MNGAIADPWANISKAANKTKTNIIGIIHQSFLAHMKRNNSPIVPNLVKKLPDFRFFLLTIDNSPFVNRGVYS
jgi:hypothetical protein